MQCQSSVSIVRTPAATSGFQRTLATVTQALRKSLVLSILLVSPAHAKNVTLSCTHLRVQPGFLGVRCPSNTLLKGIRCDGGHCSHLEIECCGPAASVWRFGQSSPSPRFPDGDLLGWIDRASFLRGVDRVEDTVRLIFVSSPNVRNTGRCTSVESSRGEIVSCPNGTLGAGLTCIESSCEDVILQCCGYKLKKAGSE